MFALLRKTRKAGTLLAAMASLTLAACGGRALRRSRRAGSRRPADPQERRQW